MITNFLARLVPPKAYLNLVNPAQVTSAPFGQTVLYLN